MYKKELDFAIKIAKQAGEIMLKYFDIEQSVEFKSDNTPVTIADKEINTLVIEGLRESFPKDSIIGEEESATVNSSGRNWFCDPIDGTSAFVCNIPTAMFSLALIVDGKPVVGVVYDPFLNRLYTSVVGEKSYCNGEMISVNDTHLENGTVAVTGNVKSILSSSYIKRLTESGIRTISFSGGVYKGCLVAKGKLTAYVEHTLNAYDIAAVHLIVENAGGKVTAFDGKVLDYSKQFKGAIISNGKVHVRLVGLCND